MTTRTSYSKAEIAFIKRTYRRLPASSPRPRLYKLFVEKFGRTDVRYSNFKRLCQELGLKASHSTRVSSMSMAVLSPAELRFLERGRDLSPQELHEEFVRKFGRSDLTEQALYNRAKRKGFRRSTGPRDKPIGSETVSSDGYVWVKADHKNDRPYRGQWHRKHTLLWERKNGPMPRGHRLKCIDGNKSNTDPSNWECVPLGVLSRLRKRRFKDAPAELKSTIMAVTRLEHELRRGARAE